jgi:DNA topoisomerase-1
VAQALGNTPTICRRCYVHPAVIDAYLEGTLHDRMADPPAIAGLDPDEEALLALLTAEAAQEA